MEREKETRERFHSAYSRYGLAVAAVVAAVLVRWALNPLLGTRIPYLTIYPAMMVVAVSLGSGPALVTTLLGVLLAELFFVEPVVSLTLTPSLGVRALILVLASFYVGRVGERLRAARARAEAEAAAARQADMALRKAHDELETRVRERTAGLTAEIEERKQAEEASQESKKELRHLSSQLLVVQEKERREIAQDLHDNIWQILNTVKFEVDGFLSRQAADNPAAARKSAERIISNIRNAIERIRTMQGDLWPPLLDDIGILATINWYCREFEKNHAGISIEKQIGVTEEDVPAHVKIVVYRVMQQALENVARHSGASRAAISLRKSEETIEFAINDNGGGFDIGRILFRTRPWIGFGLMGMRERIEHSGGTFDVRSGDGTGTTIRASWPLADTGQNSPDRGPARRISDGPEEQFRIVTEAISDWVYAFRVAPEGKYVWEWITPGFTKVTGYPNDADLAEIVHPEDRHVLEERFRYIRALRPHVSEYRIVTKNGEICWVRDSMNPAADPLHPGTIRVIGAAQNITERMRAEAALREGEERFRVAITGSPVTVYQHDKELRYTWVYNPPPGFSAETLLGKRIDEVHPPEEAAYLTRIKRQVMESGVGMRGESWLTFNGERRFVDFSIEPLRDGSGQISGVTCATVDITEHKRVDEALRESEERFRGAVETYPYGFGIYDGQRRYLYANPWTQQVAGLPLDRMVGRTDEEIFGPEVAQVLVPHLRRAYETGEMQSFEWTMPQERGGRVAIVNYVPLLDPAGKVRRVIKTIQDITAQKKAEEALRKTHDELEARVRERTSELSESVDLLRAENTERKRLEDALRESEKQVRFFASECLTAQEAERKRIAGELHDSIVASLSAIKFRIEKAADEIKQGIGTPDSLRDLISKVVQAVEETRRIMSDLRPAILDDLGITAALSWYCREFQNTYSYIRVEKEIALSEGEVPDSLKTQIFRISQEALNNIAKHSKAALVNLSIRKVEGRIELTIQDNGQGFNLHRAAKGRGLSTMRERAHLSGASYTIESAEGKGTLIRASWPLDETR